MQPCPQNIVWLWLPSVLVCLFCIDLCTGVGSSPPGSGNLSSPEPEGSSSSSNQSRIDKWKAKHEAMLKLAAEGRREEGRRDSLSPPPEQSKLVITLSEKEDEDEKEVAESARFPGRSLSTALVV